MAKYWKTLGLKRAPATLKLLDMAYNTRMEALLRADDTDGIEELHDAYKKGKKALNAVLEDVQDETPDEGKAPRRKRAPSRSKSGSSKSGSSKSNTSKSGVSKKASTKKSANTPKPDENSDDDGVSLDDFFKSTPEPKPEKKLVIDFEKPPSPNGFDELDKELKAKNDAAVKKEKAKQAKREKRKQNWDNNENWSHLLKGPAEFLKRYFDFKGRTSRGRFWGAFIIIAGLYGVFFLLDAPEKLNLSDAEGYNGEHDTIVGMFSIFMLGTIIPAFSVTLRRLHDIGKGGGWFTMLLIGACLPFFNYVALLIAVVFMAAKGEKSLNKYGPPPNGS
ncbi:MAG: DUF805 domain-containing protein [Maricaulaceae bacterium]